MFRLLIRHESIVMVIDWSVRTKECRRQNVGACELFFDFSLLICEWLARPDLSRISGLPRNHDGGALLLGNSLRELPQVNSTTAQATYVKAEDTYGVVGLTNSAATPPNVEDTMNMIALVIS